jgi:hypothetical protein
MPEALSTTISFMRSIGTTPDCGYAPVYSPVFQQSPRPAPLRRAQSVLDAHQAGAIPAAAHALTLLTAPRRPDVHSFESLVAALAHGRSATGQPAETRPAVRRVPSGRHRRVPLSPATGLTTLAK